MASWLFSTAIKLVVILILVSTSSITSAEVQGCTNPLANNYDSSATQDDGSCVINGCTDPFAINYDSSATQDDYSCYYDGGGWSDFCENPEADNYGEIGSCVINGCTNWESRSYNPDATSGNPYADQCEFPSQVTFEIDMSDYVGSETHNPISVWLWLPDHGDLFGRESFLMEQKFNWPNIYVAPVMLYDEDYPYRFSLQNPEETLDGLESPVGLIADGCATQDNNRSIRVDDAGYSYLYQGYHSYDDQNLSSVAYGSCSADAFEPAILEVGDVIDFESDIFIESFAGADGSVVEGKLNVVKNADAADSAGNVIARGGVIFPLTSTDNLVTADVNSTVPATIRMKLELAEDSNQSAEVDSTVGHTGSGLETLTFDFAGTNAIDANFDTLVLFSNFGNAGAGNIYQYDNITFAGGVVAADIPGCTDPYADNYDLTATEDNGSCTYLPPPAPVSGCINPDAYNWNPSATYDDGSCKFYGCTDPYADNFDLTATEDDGSCIYPPPPAPVYGCINPDADNWNPSATYDDGSCKFYGCTDPYADNYDLTATEDNGSCTYPPPPPPAPVYGCTNPAANNYDSAATSDDGGCTYPNWDFDGNGDVDALTDGLLLVRYAFGLRGESLSSGSIATDSLMSSGQLVAEIESALDMADIDDDGEVGALTDGLILLRYLFGLRGDQLSASVVGLTANRNSNEEIEAYIESYMP
jgi:hypothetical protein